MQDSSRLGAAQNVAFNAAGGASAASTAFGAQTYQIRVSVSGTGFVAGTGGVRVKIGDGTPAATATDTFIPNIAVEYFTVTPGQKIAVIGNDAGTGNLSVTEIALGVYSSAHVGGPLSAANRKTIAQFETYRV